MRVSALVIITFLLAGCTRGTHSGDAASADAVQQLAAQRVRAAEDWLVRVSQSPAGGGADAALIDRRIAAARSLAIARAESAADPQQRREAYRAYRDQCAAWLRQAQDAGNVPPDALSQLRYAIADAEWRMGSVQD